MLRKGEASMCLVIYQHRHESHITHAPRTSPSGIVGSTIIQKHDYNDERGRSLVNKTQTRTYKDREYDMNL